MANSSMKLVTLETRAKQSRIGAMHGADHVIDLHTACALYLHDVEGEAIFYRMADALVPPDMRALFRGGDTSLDAAHRAFEYAAQLGPDARGPCGEPLIYAVADIQLKAPIIPKKFFHT